MIAKEFQSFKPDLQHMKIMVRKKGRHPTRRHVAIDYGRYEENTGKVTLLHEKLNGPLLF